MSQPDVSIIVPTFRRPFVLSETLRTLIDLDYPKEKYEITVVDDGSNDETAQVVKSFQSSFPNLNYHFQKNRGVATARNQGARLAHGDILIFNDDDILVAPDLIQKHLKNLSVFGDCLVNGHWEFTPEMTSFLKQTPFGRFRLSTEIWVKKGIEKRLLCGNCYEPSGVTACNLSMRREVFWRIGGFDENFPYAGCEDQEFSLRAAKAGYKFIYDYDIKLWHNDHRLTLQQFAERQRRGAITKVLMAVKFPDEVANHPMIIENGIIKENDPGILITKKIVKRILSTAVATNLSYRIIEGLEKTWSGSFLLPHLYNGICGGYIFRGIREGIACYGDPRAALETVNSFKSQELN